MPKLKFKSLVGLAVSALVVAEALLHVGAALLPAAPPSAVGANDRILFLGDAHVSGLTAAPGTSVPDQLQALLLQRDGGAAPQVANGAQAELNSAELLIRLEEQLREPKPKLLVVMAGDADSWNLHLLPFFLDGKPTVRGFLAQLRLARLLGLSPELFPRPPPGRSIHFPDTPLAETPTLAMRWTGYVVAHLRNPRLDAAEAEEAVRALRAWLADPRAGDQPLAARSLVELLLRGGHGAEAGMVEEEYLARHALGHAPLFREPEKVVELYGEAKRAGREAGTEGTRAVLREAFRLNPFSAGGEPPSYELFRFLPPEDFVALLAGAMPPAVGADGKPGLGMIRESLLDDGVIPAWTYHDLGALIRLARSRGIGVMLATYPPERFSGCERAADTVIRRVATALAVPLSDISGELRRRWNGRALEEFYGSPGLPPSDDHLNAKGNALVAKILLEDLVRAGLVR